MTLSHQFTILLLTLPLVFAQQEYRRCANDIPADYPNPQQAWSAWTKIDGPDLSSEPTVSTRDGEGMEVYVCARSQEAGRWLFLQGSWTPYQTIQSGISSVPYTVRDNPSSNNLVLYAKDLDNTLVHMPCNTFRCTYNWLSEGGVLLHAPTAVSFEADRVDVFVVNTGRSVSWKTTNGGPYSEWKSLPNPGAVVRKLAAVSRLTGSIDLFGIGTDNHIYHRSYTHSNQRWTNWVRTHDRTVTSAPAVVSPHPLRIDLFVKGEANDILQTTWLNGKWSGFTSLGGVLTSAPGAVARTGNRIDVFGRGTDMKLYQKSFA